MKKIILFTVLVSSYFSMISQIGSRHFEKDESVNLFVFIGEKISVIEFDPNENNEVKVIDPVTKDTIIKKRHTMDYAFRVKFKVLQNVFNELKTDTIEFVAYNHYGRPGFESYKNSIIYISKNERGGYYYHQKYQFNPLKRVNREWQGLKGESIKELFENKKNGVLKARGLFEEN